MVRHTASFCHRHYCIQCCLIGEMTGCDRPACCAILRCMTCVCVHVVFCHCYTTGSFALEWVTNLAYAAGTIWLRDNTISLDDTDKAIIIALGKGVR